MTAEIVLLVFILGILASVILDIRGTEYIQQREELRRRAMPTIGNTGDMGEIRWATFTGNNTARTLTPEEVDEMLQSGPPMTTSATSTRMRLTAEQVRELDEAARAINSRQRSARLSSTRLSQMIYADPMETLRKKYKDKPPKIEFDIFFKDMRILS